MSDETQTQNELPEGPEVEINDPVTEAPEVAPEAPAVEAPAAGSLSVTRDADYAFTAADFQHLAAALELPMEQVSFAMAHAEDSTTPTATPKA
jgi:hypothetical protein